MSKTATGFRQPHCLAPVVGGGGYLVADLFGVNRSFRTLPARRRKLRNWAQKPFRGRRGASLITVRSDSIEARENTHLLEKIKGLIWPPSLSPESGPARAGGGYLVGAPEGVNVLSRRSPARGKSFLRKGSKRWEKARYGVDHGRSNPRRRLAVGALADPRLAPGALAPVAPCGQN